MVDCLRDRDQFQDDVRANSTYRVHPNQNIAKEDSEEDSASRGTGVQAIKKLAVSTAGNVMVVENS